MSVKISKRLEQVASYVPKGAVLADIGSDHAYLPLFLKKKNWIQRAVAGEVVEGPYQSALKNVAESGESQSIVVRLANGLAAVEASDQIDTVTIAGMGGRLIATILEEGMDRLTGVKCLVLQPNNREDELRVWLMEHGFQIVAESILEENGKLYEILVVEPGQMILSKMELRFGPYLLQEKSFIFQKKWQKEQEKLETALSHVPVEKVQERALLEAKIQQIREVLDVGE